MAELLVPVAEIQAIREHPDADALEIAEVLGWQLVVRKGTHSVGQRIVYVPPDAIVPVEVSDAVGVTRYLQKGRVRAARLRGEPSFGFTLEVPDPAWPLGTNCAGHFGITKYQPPSKLTAGDAERDHALFVRYTTIENLRNYPDMIRPDEAVMATEKIHGTNCRVGHISGEWMAGSNNLRRKQPETDWSQNIYWMPLSIAGVKALVESFVADGAKQVILFGEVFGKVQKLTYGLPGRLGFRAFDLLVDGRYLDAAAFRAACNSHGVEMVPVVAEGLFGELDLRALAEGHTLIGGDHYREGVVIRPLVERHDATYGRVIGKYISDTYLTGGVEDEAHD
ncbi:MAG: RNA ligase (ATP) [Planctomycetota bacterium]